MFFFISRGPEVGRPLMLLQDQMFVALKLWIKNLDCDRHAYLPTHTNRMFWSNWSMPTRQIESKSISYYLQANISTQMPSDR